MAMPFVMLTEVPFFTHRTLVHMLVSGVFERYPELRFVADRAGCDLDSRRRSSSSTAPTRR